MTAGLVQGLRGAAPEAGGLLFTMLLVWLALLACRAWDRAAARRRRSAIATARALDGAPAWVTPEMVYVRGRRIVGVRVLARLDDAGGQLGELESMMVRSRRVGVR